MPFLSVQATASIDTAMADKLQKELGALISIIPGKNIDNCLIQIQGGCSLFISGAPIDAVYCEIHLFGPATLESKSALCKKINELFTNELNAKKVTLNIFEMKEWGAGPDYKS